MSLFIGVAIRVVAANQLNVHSRKLFAAAEVVKDLLEVALGFYFDIKSGEEYLHPIPVKSFGVNANFVGGWRRTAPAPTDTHAIRSLLGEV